MTTRQQVYARAKELGATVQENHSLMLKVLEVTVTAPDGQHFVSCGTFELVWQDCDGDPIAEAWSDLLERLGPGLEPCGECCGHLE